MLGVRLAFGIAAQMALYAALLFGPAGTLAWWRAWVVMLLYLGLGVWSSLRLPRQILEERLSSPIQRGQPTADKLFVVVLGLVFLGATIFIPLDVFHLHLLPRPGLAISSFGLALAVTGAWIAYRALHDNAFAAPAVRHEAQQVLADQGSYAIVRHPMYAGATLIMIGTPLWLESSAGALVALLPAACMAWRTRIEESFLRRELPGYEDYTHRVRWRLVPHVW